MRDAGDRVAESDTLGVDKKSRLPRELVLCVPFFPPSEWGSGNWGRRLVGQSRRQDRQHFKKVVFVENERGNRKPELRSGGVTDSAAGANLKKVRDERRLGKELVSLGRPLLNQVTRKNRGKRLARRGI